MLISMNMKKNTMTETQKQLMFKIVCNKCSNITFVHGVSTVQIFHTTIVVFHYETNSNYHSIIQ